MNKKLPLIFTLARLIGAPILVPLFILINFYLPFVWLSYVTLFVYSVAAATDFLDGYFARKYHVESKLGQVLDYTADKIFMLGVLLALVAIGRLSMWWALALLSREFLVTGFRILAYEYHVNISVSWLGKLKTAVHFCTMALLILDIHFLFPVLSYIIPGLLILSVVLSWYSAYDYGKKLQHYIHETRV